MVTVRRGWSSADLPVISADDARFWSIADAAVLLGPPTLTPRQFRDLVRVVGLEPAGKRPAGAGRRYVRVYSATDLIVAFEQVHHHSE